MGSCSVAGNTAEDETADPRFLEAHQGTLMRADGVKQNIVRHGSVDRGIGLRTAGQDVVRIAQENNRNIRRQAGDQAVQPGKETAPVRLRNRGKIHHNRTWKAVVRVLFADKGLQQVNVAGKSGNIARTCRRRPAGEPHRSMPEK